LNDNCGILSNYEVLETINEHKKERNEILKKLPKKKQNNVFPQNQIEVEDKVCDYFKKYSELEKQTPEKNQKLIQDLEKFQLTTNEKAQILNFPPRGLVDVHLVIFI
jgi:predicted nuclease with TOPRIM domain